MHRRTLQRLGLSAVLIAFWAAVLLAQAGFGLALLPALLLGLLLVHECYLGEEVLDRLRERRAPRAAARRRSEPRLRLPAAQVVSAQGIARCFALANRPPPRTLLTQS